MARDFGPFPLNPMYEVVNRRMQRALAESVTSTGFAKSGQGAVTAGTGAQLVIAAYPDGALVDGLYVENSASETVTLTTNTASTNPRIDRLVMRLDMSAKTIAPFQIVGTPAASPSPPPLVQNSAGYNPLTATTYDMPLCRYTFPGSGSAQNPGSIVDERVGAGAAAGKMWRTAGSQALTGTPTKIAMGASRVDGGITFDDAADELVLSTAGEYQLALHGYVSAGSGDGYFAINRKRSGVSDLTVLFGDFTKPAGGDKRANATATLPLAAGDRLSLVGVGPVGVSALGTSEVQGCWLEVRYVGPLDGATPV